MLSFVLFLDFTLESKFLQYYSTSLYKIIMATWSYSQSYVVIFNVEFVCSPSPTTGFYVEALVSPALEKHAWLILAVMVWENSTKRNSEY